VEACGDQQRRNLRTPPLPFLEDPEQTLHQAVGHILSENSERHSPNMQAGLRNSRLPEIIADAAAPIFTRSPSLEAVSLSPEPSD
jgi:hypothetical protein